MNDQGEFGRVYLFAIVAWALGLLVGWPILGFAAAGGWTAGSWLSIGVLKAFEWMVRKTFVPGAADASKEFTRFLVLKLPIILVVVSIVVLAWGRSLPAIAAFCAGILLTQTVIVVKSVVEMIGRKN